MSPDEVVGLAKRATRVLLQSAAPHAKSLREESGKGLFYLFFETADDAREYAGSMESVDYCDEKLCRTGEYGLVALGAVILGGTTIVVDIFSPHRVRCTRCDNNGGELIIDQSATLKRPKIYTEPSATGLDATMCATIVEKLGSTIPVDVIAADKLLFFVEVHASNAESANIDITCDKNPDLNGFVGQTRGIGEVQNILNMWNALDQQTEVLVWARDTKQDTDTVWICDKPVLTSAPIDVD